jgi:membrane protease YdiL (CAAX protease family)
MELVTVLQYHRAGHRERWRAVIEVVLVLVFWFVLLAVDIPITTAICGVKKLKDIPPGVRAWTTLADLALLIPASLLAARAMGRSPKRLFSVFARIRWRWLAVCVGIGLVCHALQTSLGILGLAMDPDRFIGRREFAPLLALVLVLVPLQAVGEELVYRGTLLQAVGSFTRSPWPAIVIAGALFTISHGLRIEVDAAIAVLGVCAGWLTVRTGGLEAAIGYHVMLNVTVFAIKAAHGHVKPDINASVHWAGTAISIAAMLMYTAIIARLARKLPPGPDEPSAQSAPPAADQVEQHAAERGVGVEHADHGGGAEPLAPQKE